MAKAMAAALVRAGVCSAADINMSARTQASLDAIRALGYGTGTNGEARRPLYFQQRMQSSRTAVFVKCRYVPPGVSLATLTKAVSHVPIARIMPNVLCAIGEGSTGYCISPCGDATIAMLIRALEAFGPAHAIPESLFDVYSAISGSSNLPFFAAWSHRFFKTSGVSPLARGFEKCATTHILKSLPWVSGARSLLLKKRALLLSWCVRQRPGICPHVHRSADRRGSTMSVRGIATLAQMEQQHPAALRDRITSPGGTTIAGLLAMERRAFRASDPSEASGPDYWETALVSFLHQNRSPRQASTRSKPSAGKHSDKVKEPGGRDLASEDRLHNLCRSDSRAQAVFTKAASTGFPERSMPLSFAMLLGWHQQQRASAEEPARPRAVSLQTLTTSEDLGAALPPGASVAAEGGDGRLNNMNELACTSNKDGSDEPGQAADFEQLANYAAPAATIPTARAGPRQPRRVRIARISEETAAAISSQQVVIDLRSICKELVENALDAGATSIDVRLMDCGLGGVEVRDNGNGISPENLEFLGVFARALSQLKKYLQLDARASQGKAGLFARQLLELNMSRTEEAAVLCFCVERSTGSRHATSKISSFEDIYSKLDSLGFRGEALSSLCFVSRLSIVTRCRSADFGTRIFFDQNGRQVVREAAAREVGTTVSVEDIFARMPLRRRTMEQTKQRQLQDALALMQRIALLHATSCRIVFSNFDPNTGGRSTFLATKGTSSGLMEAALAVYGSKQLAACTEIKLSGKEPGREWRLEAVISRPPHGVRSAGLQHFFVKRRAVEFPQLLQKLLNKKWKEVSSRGLFPVCLAFLELDASLLDINVRKDKQQVLLAVERDIAQALLEAVSTTLAPSVGSFGFGPGEKQRQLSIKTLSMSHLPESSQGEQADPRPLRDEEREQIDQDDQRTQQYKPQQEQGQPSVPMEPEERRVSGKAAASRPSGGCSLDGNAPSIESDRILIAQVQGDRGVMGSDGDAHSIEGVESQHGGAEEATGSLTALLPSEGMRPRQPLFGARRQRSQPRQPHEARGAVFEEQQQLCQQEQQLQEHRRFDGPPDDAPVQRDLALTALETAAACSPFLEGRLSASSVVSPLLPMDEEADFIAAEVMAAAVGECRLNLNEVYSVVETDAFASTQGQRNTADDDWMSTKTAPAWADAPTDFSLSAGDAAPRGVKDTNFFLFKKDFFSDLKLVGQFNEGFIIASLRHTRRTRNQPALARDSERAVSCGGAGISSSGSADRSKTVNSLFIIDQHASDEKRIFEALNEEFRPRMQPLISPLKLNLPAELIAAVEAFAPHLSANGFGWIVCNQESPQWPLQLSQSVFALPHNSSAAKTRQTSAFFLKSLTDQQQSQAEPAKSAKESKVRDVDTWDACAPEDDEEVVLRERRCFLTGLPVVEGRQLTASDFLDFLAALASEDQGKAMWKGTMPQPVPPASEGRAQSQRASPHHRVLQYRPSRVWDILASKACRSAVMIGDALAPHRQLAILRRMATLQLPFNCPHGRPTMRHLIDVSDKEFEHESGGNFSGEARHQQSLQAKEIYVNTQPSRALNSFGSELGDTTCRKKRPASPAQHLDNQHQKIHHQDPQESQHFPTARQMYKDGPLRTACQPSTAQTVPGDDDSPSLFSEDDDLLAQEESQVAGSTVGIALDATREEVGTAEQESDTATQRAFNGLCLTFIG
ncbi:hypothetical protein ACSSS7_002413 [Eimeria intestinalis]